MLFRRLFSPSTPTAKAPRALYAAAVAQARRPEFYRDLQVPDTLDGRFELIALHVYLLLRRVRRDHTRFERLGQNLFDTMFADMDGSLREMGAGDLGVGPKVKKMAQNFYGRIAAYDAGLDGDRVDLEDALLRNLYGTLEAPPNRASLSAMADYAVAADAALAQQDADALARGRAEFAAPPAVGAGSGSTPTDAPVQESR
jgi:cytochrome b pre-mRNA-processing protein 3